MRGQSGPYDPVASGGGAQYLAAVQQPPDEPTFQFSLARPRAGFDLIYECDRSALGPALAASFTPLAGDAELAAWLAHWRTRPHGPLVSKLADLLSGYATSYDVHGWLGAYQMHLLSGRAWGELLGHSLRGSLLDVGAGAGYVTEGARRYFERIVCTETSAPLRRRLRKRGFEALASDLTDYPLDQRFDVVSCFNVLDRTARPLSLLQRLTAHMADDGRLMLSMPLPPAPHVHVRGGTVSARERLPCTASSWEGAARELTEQLLRPLSLRVERLARLPYLSRGDSQADIYVLDAALWVCRRG